MSIYRINRWIASRSYFPLAGEPRAAISNEKRHEFIILDGVSAELWSHIEEGITEGRLKTLAADRGVADELPEFLEELRSADLIALDGPTAMHGDETCPLPPPPPR